MRKYYANAHREPFEAAQKIPPLEHFKNLVSLAKTGDAFIMAGDILDVVSGANIRAFEGVLSGVKTPYIYVCGNHEPSAELPDGFIVRGKAKLEGNTELEAYHDHRLAMSFYVAGLVCEKEITINGFEWTNISFPEFEYLMEALN